MPWLGALRWSEIVSTMRLQSHLNVPLQPRDGSTDGHEVEEGTNPEDSADQHTEEATFCETHTCPCEYHDDPACVDTTASDPCATWTAAACWSRIARMARWLTPAWLASMLGRSAVRRTRRSHLLWPACASCESDCGACGPCGLVGHWKLDDGSGIAAADETSFDNDGVLVNASVRVPDSSSQPHADYGHGLGEAPKLDEQRRHRRAPRPSPQTTRRIVPQRDSTEQAAP